MYSDIVIGLADSCHVSKYLAMCFASISVIINTPMLISILGFEADCQNRTLLNR
jgi:hypothetical protein